MLMAQKMSYIFFSFCINPFLLTINFVHFYACNIHSIIFDKICLRYKFYNF